MKKNWVRGLGVIGALLTVQSVVWEYARMRPDYGFIVNPWSMLGRESVHGWIAVAAGAVALTSFLLVAWKRSEQPANGIAITVFMAAAATVIAAAFGGGDYSLTPGFFLIAVLTLVIGMVAFRLTLSAAKDTPIATQFALRMLTLILAFGATGLVLNALIGGKDITMPQWLAVGIVFGLVAALSMAPEPRQLAANRMLMFSSVIGAAALAISAGAVRSTLVRLQTELGEGPAALYKDTQVTSGHLLAVIGLVLVFFAGVALWAQRRDAILTAARAARQREAAEASAAEIAAALEKITQQAQA